MQRVFLGRRPWVTDVSFFAVVLLAYCVVYILAYGVEDILAFSAKIIAELAGMVKQQLADAHVDPKTVEFVQNQQVAAADRLSQQPLAAHAVPMNL